MKWWPFKQQESPRPVEVPLLERLRSHNGYEREYAVLEAQRLRHGPSLPLLLERANDWVPQVRTAAQNALRSLLDPALLASWCEALEAILTLERAGRTDHRVLLEDMRAYLAAPECLPAVVAAAAKGPEQLRRFAFDLQWSAARDNERPALLRSALGGSDRLQARAAAARVEQLPDLRDRLALAKTGCDSRFAPVRAQSLRLLLALGGPGATTRASTLCLDRSSAVRSIAWEHVRKTAEAGSVINRARTQFQTAATVRDQCAALEFLVTAAAGSTQDLCEQAFGSKQPRLRFAALGALLSRTDHSQQEDLLVKGLKDPSGKVQGLAVRAVLRGALPPPAAAVMEIALAHHSLPALRRGFGVISRTSPWERLTLLLKTMEADLPSGGTVLCIDALGEWRRDAQKNFLPLQQVQRQEVETAWLRLAPKVPEPLRAQINFHLS